MRITLRHAGRIRCDASNDRIPRDEIDLATMIADINILWEPGRDRTERIAYAVHCYSNGYDLDRDLGAEKRKARTERMKVKAG